MDGFGAEELLVRLAIVMDQASRMAVTAAEYAGRGDDVAVGTDRENDAVFQYADLAGQAAAAAMASGGTRILNEGVLVDQQAVSHRRTDQAATDHDGLEAAHECPL